MVELKSGWPTCTCRFREESTNDRGFLEKKESVVGPLQDCEPKRFVVKTEATVELKCIPVLVLYYNYSCEGKDISAVPHDATVEKQCVRFIMSGVDNINDQKAHERSMRMVKIVGRGLLENLSNRIASIMD